MENKLGFGEQNDKGHAPNIGLLSSAVRSDGILSANEQIINFFILYSADGFG